MPRIPTGLLIAVALAIAVGVGTAVAPLASSQPDGLEKVAEEKAFAETGRAHAVHNSSPIPDYAFPGVANERVATGLAGFVGSLGVFALMSLLALGLRRRARGRPSSGGSGSGGSGDASARGPHPAPSG